MRSLSASIFLTSSNVLIAFCNPLRPIANVPAGIFWFGVRAYVRVDVCMYVICMYKEVCMYIWMHGCMDVCMYAWMHGCMYVCMDVCMYGCKDGCMDVMYKYVDYMYA